MWLHVELCKDLFITFHEVSYQNFFGTYLHALVVRAPVQYEIVFLCSVNAENHEGLFQQAKRIATNTTNRKP